MFFGSEELNLYFGFNNNKISYYIINDGNYYNLVNIIDGKNLNVPDSLIERVEEYKQYKILYNLFENGVAETLYWDNNTDWWINGNEYLNNK